MRFNLDGLDVFFPYDYLYKEQYDYMLHLKKAIDDKGHVLLEMPTGTGKTVCLVSLITSYQLQYPLTGKLIYCTRTVPEMTKCMEEIRRVINYRIKLLGPEGGKVLALCLSSRRNMCIHPRVIQEGDRETVDGLCRNMTASWIRDKVLNPQNNTGMAGCGDNGTDHPELCEFYEGYSKDGAEAAVPSGVFSLDDLKELGGSKGHCPYFMTRHLINHATILVYNYQYMLDPKISNLISRDLENTSIVVFDEAHNIDNVCIEALSVTLDKKMLDSSSRSISKLNTKINDMKSSNNTRLQQEYNDLIRGLASENNTSAPNNTSSSSSSGSSAGNNANGTTNSSNNHVNNISSGTGGAGGAAAARGPAGGQRNRASLQSLANSLLSSPILPNDILAEAIPGNIRKAEHFISFLKKIVTYLKTLLSNKDVENKTPLAFLHAVYTMTALERKPLRFTYTRLNSLLYTLQITSLDEYTGLQEVANFMSLVATYLEGFAVIIEPQGSVVSGVMEPLIQLCCLNASIAIKPVLEKFQSVVITSGTLSPISLYPKLLALDTYTTLNGVMRHRPILRQSFQMSTFRPCLLPLIVTRGNDQIQISTRYELRQDVAVIRNYGQLLIDTSAAIPDGICCFFTSYSYMEYILNQWDKMKVLEEVLKNKLIFIETKDVVETTLALDNYKRACDNGRGAVFLSVARGKVAEGIDFDRHYGRAVILFGIPYQYTLSHTLRARLNFMRDNYDIKDNDFLTFDALRQASQCIGRIIRNKTDYGIVILADARYQRADKRSKFPPWITQFIRESSQNLSADVAVDQIKTFLRQMGQPIEEDVLHSILLNEQQVHRHNIKQNSMSIFPSIVNTAADNVPTIGTAGVTGAVNGDKKITSSAVDGETDLELQYLLETEEELIREANAGHNIIFNNGSSSIANNTATGVAAGASSDVHAYSSFIASEVKDAMDVERAILEQRQALAQMQNTGTTAAKSSGSGSGARSATKGGKSMFLFEDILDCDDDDDAGGGSRSTAMEL